MTTSNYPDPLSGTAGSAATGPGARVVGGDRGRNEGPGPDLMAADTLEGDDIYNHQGDKLGTLRHIMLDVRQGRIAYAVLSRGGVLGMGDKMFAIPWAALTLDADRKCFLLDISESQLEASPGFDKNHWPSMADTTWAMAVHTQYHQQPYWY